MDSINVNLDNLIQPEREQLMKLIKKGNRIKGKVWKPSPEGTYYCITTNGTHNLAWSDQLEGDYIDNFLYSIGNCYPTKEDAKFAIEKRKVLIELQRYADEHNEDVLNWDNNEENKCYIVYNHGSEKIEVYPNQYLQSNVTYFSNETIALEAIQSVGEARIKKYLFNVEY